MTAPFYVHKRPTRDPKRFVYYCQFVDAKGNRSTAISTGQTTRAKAERWARERAERGSAVQPTLWDFAEHFFDWNTSAWIKRQHAKGRHFSEPVARQRQSHLDTYVLPEFGDRQLADIDQKSVEDWIAGLSLSGQSLNHILYTFRIVLREAKLAGIVRHNVLADAEPFGVNPKKRDTFSLAELHQFFPEDEDELVRIWQDNARTVAFVLLASTGIRSGELRALRWLNVLSGRALYIDSSLDQMSRLKSTKTGVARCVLLPARAQAMLADWRELTKWKTPVDFIISLRQGVPHDRAWLARTLPGAMERAGIDRTGRNLVVHSFRHTFVTLVRALAPDAIAQAMSGHASTKMLDGYTHRGPEALLAQIEPARDAVEALWKDEDKTQKLTPGDRP